MQLSFTQKKNVRKSFGKLAETLSIPNLIEVQKNSYKQLTDFFQSVTIYKCNYLLLKRKMWEKVSVN